MSNRTLHPSELAQLVQTRLTAKTAAIGALVMGLLLLAGGHRSNDPQVKMLLFGTTLGCAIVTRTAHRIANEHAELFQDAKDVLLTNWQDQLFRRTRGADLTLEAEVIEPDLSTEPLPLFKWSDLSDEDEHPVIALVSPMGGGKSRLVKYLAKYAMFDKQPEIVAFDIYARNSDWPNAATDHAAMLRVMELDLEDIGRRLPQYRSGTSEFVPQVRVLEEAVDSLPAIAAQSKQSAAVVDDWLRKHVSVARKLKYRLMLVSVKLSGNDIGIGAESRDDATIIFPGLKGIAKALSDTRYMKLGTKQNAEIRTRLQHTLRTIDRPALVYHSGDWFPASIPELTASGDPVGAVQVFTAATISPPPPGLDQDLVNSIAALCDRLQGKRDNCTPGNVRKYLRVNLTDEEVLNYFQILAEDGLCSLDTTGKTPKITPIAHLCGDAVTG